jgi:alpha-D-ribose 1-methylphosphonate 5-triphosphate synthase subunit PhnG
MIPAEDSVEGQPFYLGEALVTECEVVLNEQAGFGICLGDEPVRCYCIAFLDAAMQLKDAHDPAIMNFLKEQDALVTEVHVVEYNHIQRTKVDFKLMEQD